MGSGLKAIPGKLENLSVTRYADGAYVNGRWVKGATSVIIVRASVQPVNPEMLEYLPDTMRTTDAIVLYGPDPILTANEATGQNADKFPYLGETYEIHKVWDWTNTILDHYKAIAVRTPREK